VLPSAVFERVGTPGQRISRLNSRPACTPVQRFADALTSASACLGATVVRWSFDVGTFHSLLHAGLSRRSEKHVNCFLVEKELPTEGYRHIQELVDLRLLHLVKSRVTVRDRPGKIYEAYLLDLSQYTGERKKRDMKILEFWKTGTEDELRRTALIYEPSSAPA
jgi:hypothetical protein